MLLIIIISRNSMHTSTLLLRPGRGAEYCNQPVCLSVYLSACLSVREHISGTAGPIFTKFCVQIPCGRGSVLLWQCCDMLCTSGVMNDVTFGRNGRYGETWRLHHHHEATTTSGVAIPEPNVNGCLVFHCNKCPVLARSLVTD